MAEKGGSYRDLIVWQRSISLAAAVYQLTRTFPRDEQFGLTSQMRRAAMSIAANIAEGHGRGTRGAYAGFLRIARGSLRELATLLILAQDVEIASAETASLLGDCDAIGRMLHAIIGKLRTPPPDV